MKLDLKLPVMVPRIYDQFSVFYRYPIIQKNRERKKRKEKERSYYSGRRTNREINIKKSCKNNFKTHDSSLWLIQVSFRT